ncbi:hypothetical protein CONCODRAFT_18283 [Conidiobolus coronatus NRRL 28638]|uniref:Uncharacterized protein n=1 Tax=Conidiobolus coronatus (strain ATCC 28846 / CBS 209.66 / NRRL 28638) TaxID=796925 RepID=A0A137P3I8_CONC2|nr:hypothetical protein CONCODRAFT_18283 [Conidiobolus coronatus NRRL 28638]|eukprot:KXN69509.1 hypothetical protein CONCODRAFT_18283 [Conidiobolus coronatus NRRL 28638]
MLTLNRISSIRFNQLSRSLSSNVNFYKVSNINSLLKPSQLLSTRQFSNISKVLEESNSTSRVAIPQSKKPKLLSETYHVVYLSPLSSTIRNFIMIGNSFIVMAMVVSPYIFFKGAVPITGSLLVLASAILPVLYIHYLTGGFVSRMSLIVNKQTRGKALDANTPVLIDNFNNMGKNQQFQINLGDIQPGKKFASMVNFKAPVKIGEKKRVINLFLDKKLFSNPDAAHDPIPGLIWKYLTRHQEKK